LKEAQKRVNEEYEGIKRAVGAFEGPTNKTGAGGGIIWGAKLGAQKKPREKGKRQKGGAQRKIPPTFGPKPLGPRFKNPGKIWAPP